jgi:hypothetical protein
VIDYLGWMATAVFVGSYFFKRPGTLRRVQMAGAAMWVAYGFLIGAAPVMAANLLVLGAAAWTASRNPHSALPKPK